MCKPAHVINHGLGVPNHVVYATHSCTVVNLGVTNSMYGSIACEMASPSKSRVCSSYTKPPIRMYGKRCGVIGTLPLSKKESSVDSAHEDMRLAALNHKVIGRELRQSLPIA